MPELAAQFATCDLFVAEFKHSCLNRLQLRDNQKMVDFDNPDVGSELRFTGTLANPIYSRSSMRGSRPATL